MSEPYAVLTRVTMGRSAVRAYLDAERKPARSYGDWRRCTGFIDTGSLDATPDGWSKWLAHIDGNIRGTHRDGYQFLREGAPPTDFRFYYDEAQGTLTQASVLYDQGASALVWHLSLTRALCSFLSEGESGLTAVHDPIWGNGTVAVFALRPGESPLAFDGTGRLDAELAAVLDDIAGEFMVDEPGIRDELDGFR